MTKRQIVYYILDSIKSINGDSYITEDHVLFLINNYRLYLIELKRQKDKITQLSDEYYQEICLDLELVDGIPGVPCTGQYLKSKNKIPTTINGSNTLIYPYDYFNTNITFVPRDRFSVVGYNKYMNNIIYATIGSDNYLYLKSNNPQYEYLEKVRMSGIFDDYEKAEEISCDCNCEENCIDPMDKDFPMASDLLPQMIDIISKELYNALVRPADRENDSADTISDLVNYIRHNMKSDLAKQLTA